MDLLDLVGSYAFPIVACIAMAWYVKYTTDKNHDDLIALQEKHKSEMYEITQALNNNTLVVQKLCTLIEQSTSIELVKGSDN